MPGRTLVVRVWLRAAADSLPSGVLSHGIYCVLAVFSCSAMRCLAPAVRRELVARGEEKEGGNLFAERRGHVTWGRSDAPSPTPSSKPPKQEVVAQATTVPEVGGSEGHDQDDPVDVVGCSPRLVRTVLVFRSAGRHCRGLECAGPRASRSCLARCGALQALCGGFWSAEVILGCPGLALARSNAAGMSSASPLGLLFNAP